MEPASNNISTQFVRVVLHFAVSVSVFFLGYGVLSQNNQTPFPYVNSVRTATVYVNSSLLLFSTLLIVNGGLVSWRFRSSMRAAFDIGSISTSSLWLLTFLVADSIFVLQQLQQLEGVLAADICLCALFWLAAIPFAIKNDFSLKFFWPTVFALSIPVYIGDSHVHYFCCLRMFVLFSRMPRTNPFSYLGLAVCVAVTVSMFLRTLLL